MGRSQNGMAKSKTRHCSALSRSPSSPLFLSLCFLLLYLVLYLCCILFSLFLFFLSSSFLKTNLLLFGNKITPFRVPLKCPHAASKTPLILTSRVPPPKSVLTTSRRR